MMADVAFWMKNQFNWLRPHFCPFMDWQVPSAVIALKQGAGRLIRDRHDRGVPVLCGPAPLGERLRQTFMASLPPMPRTHAIVDV